jgi:CheY-like chemotaxis protein
MLTQCGAHVDVAGSAAEGLQQFRQRRPDLIISDIGMPDKDGFEFIREIRDVEGLRADPVPAVALSAFAQSEDRRRALRAGFQMHVPKPVVTAELLAVIASLCRRDHRRPDSS